MHDYRKAFFQKNKKKVVRKVSPGRKKRKKVSRVAKQKNNKMFEFTVSKTGNFQKFYMVSK